MAAFARERPPEVARAPLVDPALLRAIGWSLLAHFAVVGLALLLAFFAPAPTMLDLPPGGPVVDLVSPRGDSKVFKVGPLAKASGAKGTSKAPPKPEPPKPEPKKPEPAKPEAKKPEPPKAEPPKPEPPKPEPPKVEPKPTAIPEPKKPEPPKPEPKKPEPKKPEEKKPEPKKPEEKKPEPKKPEEKKPEAKKPEPAKPEPKKPEPAKPEPAKPAAAEPAKPAAPAEKPGGTTGSPDAGSSKPGVAAPGGGTAADGGRSGDPNGGGGGTGNRSPEFYAYFAYMYESIKAQWVWAGEQDATLAATVRFSILADGNIADVRVTERSRSPLYDESALNAVRATGGLTPPPASVRADFEDVEFVFRAGEMMQP